VQVPTLTRVTTPDSRLIEIAQTVAHHQRHPSEEAVAEGAHYDPVSAPDTTGHSHAGGLLFIHESELDKEIDVSVVGDVPPTDEPALYETEAVPGQQLAEMPEPVGVFVYRQENSVDLVLRSGAAIRPN
jgi:hypothetical protein